MRLALLWVPATTIALALPGCFRPDFPAGGECGPDMSCPGELTCVGGVCCEPDDPSCGGDGDGDADAGPDADPRAFTDFLEPLSCDGDTITLLHFDSTPFQPDQSCAQQPLTTAQDQPRTDSGNFADPSIGSRFGTGARLNFGTETELNHFVNVALDPESAAPGLTIEGWFMVRDLPQAPELATIASSLHADTTTSTFDRGAWVVSVDSAQRLRVDLRTADCDAFHPDGPLFVDDLPSGVMTHFRAAITASQLVVYLDGIQVAQRELSEAPCTQPAAASLRVGGIDRGTMFEFGDYVRFDGVVDEVRYSRVARAP